MKNDLAAAVESLLEAVKVQQTGIMNVPRWAIVEVLEVLQPFPTAGNERRSL